MLLIYTLDTIFLIAELALVICLLIPAIPRKSWKQTFDSFKYLNDKCKMIFLIMVLILSVPLLMSVRDYIKYNQEKDLVTDTLKLDSAKEFQQKVDISITSASLFLWFVLNKLYMLTKESVDMDYNIHNLIKNNELLEQKIVDLLNKSPSDENVTTTTRSATLAEDEDASNRSRSRSRASKID